MRRDIIIIAFLASRSLAVTFNVPATAPASASALDPAPVGISYEFFTFPAYMNDVASTKQCMQNMRDLSGTWPPIRIGGTTQDRATYDAASSAAVTYSVANEKDAPMTLTFGPSFMSIAGTYAGSVVVGLNREKNNQANTIAAAREAKAKIPNLLAIELGNEPECRLTPLLDDPIPHWRNANARSDAQAQGNWQIAVGNGVGTTPLIQAANSLKNPPEWGAIQLLNVQNATAVSHIKTISHHNYPGGTVQSLMSHSNVIRNIGSFSADVQAAKNAGKPYVFGEMNSATGGGASGVSPKFGAALWVADVSLRAATAGISRSYFHHGTIGNCQYCWWGRYNVGAPYYGAVFATAVMAGGAKIAPLDTGSSNYGGYVVYDSAGAPIRVSVHNSDYFSGSGSRSSQQFILTGLSGETVSAKRLTAPSAESRQDQGQTPTFGGQSFENGSCLATGTAKVETAEVSAGRVTFTLAASEALLVNL
ncbi:glycoside hydrolase family 79 protein [Patellaria atrata CBS 101060]|uniref:Glycoside hydrolase family 79 protein n=1 Tax=Patellaria atrata CBS 101060 TaxID=1346257 RepID=A0A9P4SG83_9PEZI|nr:glycoside hydrolase family 79 protein [Patellaria atrata CBS 101060]